MENMMYHTLQEFASLMDGKLLLREELPFNQQILEGLPAENLLKTKPSMNQTWLGAECMRCGNRYSRYFAKIQCQKCQRVHKYCRNCIEMGRMMPCERLYYWSGPAAVWKKYQKPCSWQGELTQAQSQAAKRIKAAILKREKEILTYAVCGAGKTEMLFPGISLALEQGMRICIATPRADVVRELKPRFIAAFKDVPIQALYGGSKDKGENAQLTIATTHQLLRYKAAFDVMIIDEIDAFPFHTDPTLPFAQKRAAKPRCTTVYLTATPRKKHKKAMQSGKLPHVFVAVRYHGHPLPVPKLKMCHSLVRDLHVNRIPDQFLKWLRNRDRPERQLLIFVPTIKRATELKSPLTQLFLNQQLITTKTEIASVHASDPNRETKILAFRNKALKLLITTTILERGVTFPSVDVAIFDAGHTVFDEAALVQISGRAGRNAADPTGEVMFFHNGKTEAMLNALYSIKQMNKRGGF